MNLKSAGRLRAEAKVIRAGDRVVWAESHVFADEDLVSNFNSTGVHVLSMNISK